MAEETTERLNKVLAAAGLGSRRHCEELITSGRVTVDGQVIRELGYKVSPGQQVAVDGKQIQRERLVYWLVNKPRGYLSTHYDPAGRPRVIDLLLHVPERVYMVGRLDEESEGLMLMTNDGELAQRLMHPRYGIEKTYHVQVAGFPSKEELKQLTEGIWISDGKVRAKRVKRLGTRGKSTFLEIVLAEGKNREIRRMLAKQGHKVMRLKRIAIGPIRLGRLRPGKSRRLTLPELRQLKEIAFRPRDKDKSRSKKAGKEQS
ncbi:MAG: rRNA pseudouridine synthase [Gemmatales bacterium]|nr:rRNA pseudouridine synthase [Gemmatales bacterium]MDW8385506.1 pseudouridine synthase [Gemmatales bacterium]